MLKRKIWITPQEVTGTERGKICPLKANQKPGSISVDTHSPQDTGAWVIDHGEFEFEVHRSRYSIDRPGTNEDRGRGNNSPASWLKEQLKSLIHFSYRRLPGESRNNHPPISLLLFDCSSNDGYS